MTYMFLKSGGEVEVDKFDIEAIKEDRQKDRKKREPIGKFEFNGKEYRFKDILFFGDKCGNGKCSRSQKAHPVGEVCDYTFTEACVTCGKKMWKRDCEYSLLKYRNVFCAEHCGDKQFKK